MKPRIKEIHSKGPSILNFESTIDAWINVEVGGEVRRIFEINIHAPRKLRESFRRCVSGSTNFYTLINISFFENIRRLFQFVFCLSECRRVQVSTISLLFSVARNDLILERKFSKSRCDPECVFNEAKKVTF